jgi:uncharacterized protein YegL
MAKTTFGDIIQKIADENGKKIFLQPKKFKPLLLDYVKKDFERECNLFMTLLDAGCAKYISDAENIAECKQFLVELLEDKHSLSPKKSAEMLDMLICVLRQGESIQNKQAVLIFVVDVSGSMAGEKIGSLNIAFRELLPELKGIGDSGVDLKIAFLKFSSGCNWMHPSPVSVESFQWKALEADGESDLGAAFMELSEKMSNEEFFPYSSAFTAPIIFLMMDGEPTDDYKSSLVVLQKNIWFKCAIKVAVAIGADSDKDVLKEFTGDDEAVITVSTPEALKKYIRFEPGPGLEEQNTSRTQKEQKKPQQKAPEKQSKAVRQTKPDLANTDGW